MKKTVLITGASSGIGLEFAKIFAKNGYDLVLVARNTAKLQGLAAELAPTKSEIISMDLSDPHAPKKLFEIVTALGLEVDTLINNAGFGDFGNFHESDWTKQAQMLQLNINTLTELTHLFVKPMVARKNGKILNVASTASFQPGPLMSVYYATKHYVLAFSEAIAEELAPLGITVTTLCPGATASGFQSAAAMEESSLVKGKKLPSSEEVALYGYKALQKGKIVAIHGAMNYLMANSVRFTPRKMVLKIVRKMQEKSK